jgi:hypothetical protein
MSRFLLLSQRIRQARNWQSLAPPSCCFLLSLFFWHWWWKQYVPLKCCDFNQTTQHYIPADSTLHQILLCWSNWRMRWVGYIARKEINTCTCMNEWMHACMHAQTHIYIKCCLGHLNRRALLQD